MLIFEGEENSFFTELGAETLSLSPLYPAFFIKDSCISLIFELTTGF
jgi:hypothetical protein